MKPFEPLLHSSFQLLILGNLLHLKFYLADESGSVVGLVTFGDEVVALQEVLPDRVAVQPAHFQARTEAMPDEGTPVTLWLLAGP